MGLEEIIKTAFEYGSTLGLALVSLWMLNRVWADRVATEIKHGQALGALAEQNMKVIQANTEAITTLCERLGRDAK